MGAAVPTSNPDGPKFQISFYLNRAVEFTTSFAGRLEIGRRQANEPAPYALLTVAGKQRLVAFGMEEGHFSRKHCEIVPIANAERKVRIRNLSGVQSILLTDGTIIRPNAESEPRDLPVNIWFPRNPSNRILDRIATVDAAVIFTQPDPATFMSVDARSASATDHSSKTTFDIAIDEIQSKPVAKEPARLSDHILYKNLLTSLYKVDQSGDIFTHVVKSVEQFLLDWALPDAVTPSVQFLKVTGADPVIHSETLGAPPVDRAILNEMIHMRHPVVRPAVAKTKGGSATAIAIPILLGAGELEYALAIVLKSERAEPRDAGPDELQQCEGLAVILQTAISLEFERSHRTRDLLRIFGEFLPEKLAKDILRDPDRYEEYKIGMTKDVSVLFCDLRDYTRISRKAGVPEDRKNQWLKEVRTAVKAAVVQSGGDVFDIKGDSVAALWIAGTSIPNTAAAACDAAAAIYSLARVLNAKWESELGAKTQFGVGVVTGPANVSLGEEGYYRKFGPDGTIVNLASRLEGATKYLGVSILVCNATREKIQPVKFTLTQMNLLRLAGIDEPVQTYSILPVGTPIEPVIFTLSGK